MLRKQAKALLRRFSANDYQTLNHIELSRTNMLWNVELVRRQYAGDRIIPVLKSNAYGHGLEQTAEILNGADCAFLAVDGYFEAAKIRDITRHHILVLGYIKPENVKLLDTRKCSFVVQDVEGLRAFGRLGKQVRIHLELNTGMNRLGLSSDELSEYLKTLQQYPKLELEGVMSHLADADNDRDSSYTERQVAVFDDTVASIHRQGFSPAYVHIAQTAGSTKAKSQYANAIRLGIGLYGISPLSETDPQASGFKGLRPVLTLESTIVKVVELQKGDRVSYNGIFTAPKAMKIGVLPLGYYEGVPRELSNKGSVAYGDSDLPIVGRVCMNHTMIDLKDSTAMVGDAVTVISRDPPRPNSVQQTCRTHGLFSYQFVTKLSSSIRRTVV